MSRRSLRPARRRRECISRSWSPKCSTACGRKPATSPSTARSAVVVTLGPSSSTFAPAGAIGLDVDPLEQPRTEARLRADGFGSDVFVARQATFAGLPQVLAAEGIASVNVAIADLGVSSMQIDNPDRGFSYKAAGPLDMRMNPSRGESAWQLLARLDEDALSAVLAENADEPYAPLIAQVLKRTPVKTTDALERLVRTTLNTTCPRLAKTDVKLSVRRTFQALRVAVNEEFSSLEALLRALPLSLAPGGRVAIITFHSGEDRRVKKAFQAGARAGVYAEVAKEVVRSAKEETFANRRAAAASSAGRSGQRHQAHSHNAVPVRQAATPSNSTFQPLS